MKKYIPFALSLLLLTSCGGPAPQKLTQPTNAPQPTVGADANPFYKQIMDTKTRPIAVMIDNDDSNSRPHSGIDKAYLLYEAPVEGGSTRIMALFKDTDTAKIGPVRSSRHYFLDYVLENDATYVHFGFSPQAAEDIPALHINNINGVAAGYGAFWREEKYKGDWHSAYTSIKNIQTMGAKLGYKTETDSPFPYTMSQKDSDITSDTAATQINMSYAGFYKVSYTYDSATKLYNRFINKEPHKTSAGVPLTAKNIILQTVNVYAFGDGTDRRQIDTVGTGTGTFVTNGKSAPIKWSKTSRQAKTKFMYENGEEIKLNPGITWVQLVSKEMKVAVE